MNFLFSAILGLLQGLAEFYPVSSSGHLVVLERLIGFQIPIVTFHVFLHMGSALALVSVMRRDFEGAGEGCLLLAGELKREILVLSGRGQPQMRQVVRTVNRKTAVLILVSSAVSVPAGLALSFPAETMSASALLTGAGFFLTGILLLVTGMVKTGNNTVRDMHPWQAAVIGLMQGIAVLPGISRMALTVSMGLFFGFSRKAAVRFSCFIFVPVSAAAFVRCLIQGIGNGIFTGEVILSCIIGTAVSALTGVFVLNRALSAVRRGKLSSFAYYCFIAGMISVLVSYMA